ncbi:MAG: hypothetical protein HY907_00390 [Deltaproteobacteria bacterium]|nr:hypothetical protein [Deltaproteobacteria bacterium]MBI5498672.1 hypothetical protein [Deltaproteobacteria bacterium]
MAMTAEDLWPLVEKLPRAERLKLARLALARVALPPAATDAQRYAACPPCPDEFATEPDEDPLEWEADGWEKFG